MIEFRAEMSTSSSEWYVETSMGITLGPMPFEALVELAETSALMKYDQVRNGSKGQWQPANKIRGLFAEVDNGSSDDDVVSLSGYEVSEPQSATTSRTQSSGKASSGGVVRLGDFEVPPPLPSTRPKKSRKKKQSRKDASPKPSEPGSSPSSAVAAPPPLKAVAEAVSRQSSAPREQPESSEWSAQPKLPSVRAVPSPQAASTPPPLPGRVSVKEMSSLPETHSRAGTAAVVEHATRPTALNDTTNADAVPVSHPPAPRPLTSTDRTPVQPWSPPVDTRRQWMTRGAALLAGVSALYAVFWLFQPDYEQASYREFAALYDQHQQLLATSDKAGWTEFATGARTRLDESLPHLEAAAVPGERSKSILLYACRDLRSALELRFGSPNPHDERLAGFFSQLKDLHASSE